MTPQLRALFAIVKRCLEEADKEVAKQRERIAELKTKGQTTAEEEKTLDLMLTVSSSMRHSQAMIELQISGQRLQ